MTEFLVKHFVKDYEKTEKVSVRTGYGILASMVGIFCNVLLFLMKITIGMMIHSISVHLTTYLMQVHRSSALSESRLRVSRQTRSIRSDMEGWSILRLWLSRFWCCRLGLLFLKMQLER